MFAERTQDTTAAASSAAPPQPMVWDTLYQMDCEYSTVLGTKLREVPDMGMRPETIGSFFQA